MAIRVLIFDDNPTMRDSLTLLLESSGDFRICGALEDATGVVQAVKSLQPDIIIMDIDMPGINGLDAVSIVHKNYPEIPVLMLTVFDDVDKIFLSLRNGALGYLLKSTSPEKLREALHELYDGGAPMSPVIARKVMTHFQNQHGEDKRPDYQLSQREIEVLKLLVDGYSYKMIAAELQIGFETVRTYIKRIYEKLHVQTVTEAVTKAVREGIVK
jgi:DNA-binding NarL/FixJ family response regulator